MAVHPLSKLLLKWYQTNKRDLPWRNTNNPYYIWLSEIILQQTRVNQGLPYYLNFVENFPTVESLANAPEKKVLRLWQGLGYYSRARNLHASAKSLILNFGGKLPGSYTELLNIKGIGPYTAAAIASFAYKEKIPVVDGNVYRVLARIFGVETNIAGSKAFKEFSQLASTLIPDKDPDLFNQAIMEFGALQCVPQNPDCEACPASALCFAKKHSLQSSLPYKEKKLKKRVRYFNYLLIKHSTLYIMCERTEKDIWQGLFELPLIESETILSSDEIVKKVKLKKSEWIFESKDYKHILSHQTIHARFNVISIAEKPKFEKLSNQYKGQIISIKQMNLLPKPVLINKFLEENIFV